MTYNSDIVIIGAGPVGLFTIFQAGMLGMKSLVVDSLPHIGGQCSALYPEKPIYDIPGYPNILAEELVQKLYKQSIPFSPSFILGQSVVSYEKSGEFFVLKTDLGNEIKTKAIIIAAGSGAFGHNKPPMPNIEDFEGKSVFYSVRDRQIFKNKIVTIAGGGDSAVDWAISLAEIASKVYLIHRRNKFKAMQESINKLEHLIKLGNIELLVPYQLDSLVGRDGFLNEISIVDLDNHMKKICSDFLLLFFGLSMNLGPILSWNIDMQNKHIQVMQSTMQTSVDGIFAIGDVVDYAGKLKLILTGFAEAAIAAHSVYRFIYPEKDIHFEHSTTKGVNPKL